MLGVLLRFPRFSSRFHLRHHPAPSAINMDFLKRAMGMLATPPEKQEESATETACAPTCYPDDVPFEDSACSSCADPCSEHKQIPDYLKIDTESPLLGSMKPYKRHVLFQIPGKSWNNWAPKIEEQEGSLASELSTAAKAAGKRLGYRVLVTAIDGPSNESGGTSPPLLGPDEALVLPDLVAIGPLFPENASGAMEEFLVTGQVPSGLTTRQLPPWRQSPTDPASSSGMAACILVCSHKLRDKRCGVAGPILIEELQSACQKRGLGTSVPVLACSHVGGHKFAGNIIVYSPAGGHWYGRVKPCHAEAVVDVQIVGGRVMKELWRGRMDV